MSISPEIKNALFQYCLRLGDSSLVMGHRMSEWCGHGPILEEDIALTNISLDLIGQSRFIYSYAAELEGKGRTEDDLAYLRDTRQFYNCLITEQPKGDYAYTICQLFLFSTFQYYLYSALTKSTDRSIAAFAEKSLKEVTYHLRHSSEWVYRLGDGTEESHSRLQKAIDEIWIYTEDLFDGDSIDKLLYEKGIGVNLQEVKSEWEKKISSVFSLATVTLPQNVWMMKGSRQGNHTEYLGYLLAEMQFLPRAYPGTKW